jgi:serine O-acetyltransferase
MSQHGFFSSLKDLVRAYRKYDPATSSNLEILLLYPGVKAWVLHRIAHRLYRLKMPFFPRFFSEWARAWTGIDIHPGAQIGERVIMDHGVGIVIGETAIVGDDVLLYQGVTLGGTSLERTKRHPTIERHCVLGAGAKVLGNITVGEGCRVGANSVVVRDVPRGCTVVGVPGKIVSSGGIKEGQELEHGRLPDPVVQRLNDLERQVSELRKSLEREESAKAGA